MTLAADGLVAGIDTHLDQHVVAVLDRLGRRPAVRDFPATDAGNAQLTRWLDSLGTVAEAGVEGTGSYGYRLARALTRHGVQVREVNCPDRSRRRRRGKSDPVDAENAARARPGRRGHGRAQGPRRGRRPAESPRDHPAQRREGPHPGL